MPHVYMVTTGPGSKGTTARSAVSYSRTVTASLAGVDAGHAYGGAGLVADVELQQHGGEGLDGRGDGQRTRVQGPAAGDELDQLAGDPGGLGVVGTDEHVALHPVVQVAQLLGRKVVEGGRHQRGRGRGLHVAGHR